MVKNTKGNAPLGAGLVVLSSLLYSSYGIWTKLIGEFFGAFMQASLRSVIVVACMLPIALLHKQLQRVHWRRDAKWFGMSALSSLFIVAPLYYAILNAGMGLALSIAYIGIVLGMFFFGWLLAKERYTKDKWVSTILGVLGILLVFSPSVTHFGWLALVAALMSGFASGLNVVASKKMPYSASQTAVIAWSFGALVNLPFIFVFGEHAPALGMHIEWLYLVLFGVVSLIASWSLIQGVKIIEAGAAGVLGLLEVVFAVMLGVLFFGERLGIAVLAGIVCIIAAAAVPYVKDYNAKRGTLEES